MKSVDEDQHAWTQINTSLQWVILDRAYLAACTYSCWKRLVTLATDFCIFNFSRFCFYFFRETTATGFGRQGCRLPDPTMDPLAHSWSPVLCFCKMNHSEWHCKGKVVWWEGSVYMCLLPTQTNCTMLSLTLEGVWRTTPVHRQAYWQRSSKLQKSLPRQICNLSWLFLRRDIDQLYILLIGTAPTVALHNNNLRVLVVLHIDQCGSIQLQRAAPIGSSSCITLD